MEIFSRRFQDIIIPEPVGYSVGVSGKYKVQIVHNDRGGIVEEPFGDKWLPNLVTNAGLDMLIQYLGTPNIQNACVYCRVGTGTTPPANTDTGLVTPWSWTSTLTGSGSGYSNDTVNGTYTQTFSYEFASFIATITEFGVSNQNTNGTGANALLCRALFPSSVALASGDNLRLVHSTTWSVPATVTPVSISTSTINGFNASGQLKITGPFSQLFGTVVATQTSTTTNAGSPSNAFWMGGSGGSNPFLCSAPTTFPAVNANITTTPIASATGSWSGGTYTNGTFVKNITWSWTPTQPPTTVSNVNGMALAFGASMANGTPYYLLNSTQTKTNTQSLNLTLSCTYSRV